MPERQPQPVTVPTATVIAAAAGLSLEELRQVASGERALDEAQRTRMLDAIAALLLAARPPDRPSGRKRKPAPRKRNGG